MRKEQFIILPYENGWIVYNMKLPFKDGHTHLRNRKSAVAAVDFVLKGKIPKRTGFYYLQSLMRISDNESYRTKVGELIEVRKGKGQKTKYQRSQGIK